MFLLACVSAFIATLLTFKDNALIVVETNHHIPAILKGLRTSEPSSRGLTWLGVM